MAIIRLDTPGGLDTSTRDIVKDILAAPMPVIVYVSPERRPRRVGGRLHHPGRRRRGDGAADQHRLGDPDLDRPRLRRRGAGAEDPQRRRRLHAGAGGDPRPQPRARPRRWSSRRPTSPPTRRSRRTSSTSSPPSERELLQAARRLPRPAGRRRRTCTRAGLAIESHDMPLQLRAAADHRQPDVAFLLLTVGLIGLAIELFSPGADRARDPRADLVRPRPLRHRAAAGHRGGDRCCWSLAVGADRSPRRT